MLYERFDSSQEELYHALNLAKKFYREPQFIFALLQIRTIGNLAQETMTFDYEVVMALFKVGLDFTKQRPNTVPSWKAMWMQANSWEEYGYKKIAAWLKDSVKEQYPEIEDEFNEKEHQQNPND